MCRRNPLRTWPGTLLAAIANPRLPPTPGATTIRAGATRGTNAVGAGIDGFGDDAAATVELGFEDDDLGGGGFA